MASSITHAKHMRESEITDIVFGNVLRALRKNAELSQEKLGMDAGLERTYISMLELGQRTPTIKTLIHLSKALNLTLSELIIIFEDAFYEQTGENLTRKK